MSRYLITKCGVVGFAIGFCAAWSAQTDADSDPCVESRVEVESYLERRSELDEESASRTTYAERRDFVLLLSKHLTQCGVKHETVGTEYSVRDGQDQDINPLIVISPEGESYLNQLSKLAYDDFGRLDLGVSSLHFLSGSKSLASYSREIEAVLLGTQSLLNPNENADDFSLKHEFRHRLGDLKGAETQGYWYSGSIKVKEGRLPGNSVYVDNPHVSFDEVYAWDMEVVHRYCELSRQLNRLGQGERQGGNGDTIGLHLSIIELAYSAENARDNALTISATVQIVLNALDKGEGLTFKKVSIADRDAVLATLYGAAPGGGDEEVRFEASIEVRGATDGRSRDKNTQLLRMQLNALLASIKSHTEERDSTHKTSELIVKAYGKSKSDQEMRRSLLDLVDGHLSRFKREKMCAMPEFQSSLGIAGYQKLSLLPW